MSLWELADQPDPMKRLKCLVCDKVFRTTIHWRTCGPCKDNERDREQRQYGEKPKKW